VELIEFPEQNVIYAKDQPQYRPLPAYRVPRDPEGRVICCWSLTWRERLTLLFTGKIWHHVLTFNARLQPQLLEVDKPAMPSAIRAVACSCNTYPHREGCGSTAGEP
jgi:hypothetical protein